MKEAHLSGDGHGQRIGDLHRASCIELYVPKRRVWTKPLAAVDDRRGLLPCWCRPSWCASIEEEDLNGRLFGTLRGRNDECPGHPQRDLCPPQPVRPTSSIARHEVKPPFTSHKRVNRSDERTMDVGASSLGPAHTGCHGGGFGRRGLVDGQWHRPIARH